MYNNILWVPFTANVGFPLNYKTVVDTLYNIIHITHVTRQLYNIIYKCARIGKFAACVRKS